MIEKQIRKLNNNEWMEIRISWDNEEELELFEEDLGGLIIIWDPFGIYD